MSPLQNDFEKKLTELGLSYGVHNDALYTILNKQVGANAITVRLINSLPINKQIHCSNNGNDVQAVGRFKFNLSSSGLDPDILGLAFKNTLKNRVEFILVPLQEFLRRRVKTNPSSVYHKRVVMTIWLFENGHTYDTTNISPEGEWFYLSQGVNGRMVDNSESDYSEFLNNWHWITDR